MTQQQPDSPRQRPPARVYAYAALWLALGLAIVAIAGGGEAPKASGAVLRQADVEQVLRRHELTSIPAEEDAARGRVSYLDEEGLAAHFTVYSGEPPARRPGSGVVEDCGGFPCEAAGTTCGNVVVSVTPFAPSANTLSEAGPPASLPSPQRLLGRSCSGSEPTRLEDLANEMVFTPRIRGAASYPQGIAPPELELAATERGAAATRQAWPVTLRLFRDAPAAAVAEELARNQGFGPFASSAHRGHSDRTIARACNVLVEADRYAPGVAGNDGAEIPDSTFLESQERARRVVAELRSACEG